MRRIAIAVVAVIGLAACQQMTTEPAANSNLSIRMFGSNPPPPPIDSGSVGYSGSTNTGFTLVLTYFMNKPGTNGWLTLVETGGATGDPDARVSFHDGVVSGKGTWTIPTDDGGHVVLDLSSLGDGSRFDRNKGSYDLLLGGTFYGSGGGEGRKASDIRIRPKSSEIIIGDTGE